MTEIPDEAPNFSLDGFETKAKIVSSYDGDSFHAIFKFKGTFYNWNCRLDGIDTPELRTKNKLEKKHAIKARDRLRDLILNKIVTIKCGKFDKYGRLLTKVYINDTNVANELIKHGFGKKYDGGKKEPWDFTHHPNTFDTLEPNQDHEEDLDH